MNVAMMETVPLTNNVTVEVTKDSPLHHNKSQFAHQMEKFERDKERNPFGTIIQEINNLKQLAVNYFSQKPQQPVAPTNNINQMIIQSSQPSQTAYPQNISNSL